MTAFIGFVEKDNGPGHRGQAAVERLAKDRTAESFLAAVQSRYRRGTDLPSRR